MTKTETSNLHVLQQPFLLAKWTVDPIKLTVSSAEKQTKVSHNVMKLLLVLAENYGSLVSREYIMHHVWSDTVVTDESISRCVADLRKVLGDSARHPTYVNTISKQGYNLLVKPKAIAPVVGINRPKLFTHLAVGGVVSLCLLAFLLAMWLTASPKESKTIQPYIKTKLVISGESNRYPSLDPAGRFITYSKANEIWVYDISMDVETRLFSSPSLHFSRSEFSNDGAEIAYIEKAISGKTCKIKVFTFKTQQTWDLTTCHSRGVTSLDWMPNNESLVATFFKPKQRIAEIVEYDIRTGKFNVVVSPPQIANGYLFPSVSNQGNKLAFLSFDGTTGISKPIVFNIANKEKHIIPPSSNKVQQVVWGKDENTLFYSDIGRSASGLWEYNLQSGTKKLLINEPLIDFDYNQEEDFFVGSVVEKTMSTWRFAKGHLHNLTEDTINKTHVSLSQDGQLLAYVSNRGGNSNIWLESTKDQTLEKLTNQSSDFYTALAFSPDNRYFAYVKTNLDASTELTVLDLNNHRKEAFHMQNVGYASWSKHEQGMLYIYQTSDGGNIFKLNMASRTLSHKLPVAELRRFEVMPSGHIITQEKLNNDLTILPDPSLAKSNAQASSINIDIYTNEPWVVVGDKVSVLRQNLNQRAKIHFYDIEGKHNEMDSITLQSDSPIIFYTLSNSKEIIYYSTIDSTKHVMYKFSPLNQ